MAKQAESVINGDNSILFNSYNNNAVFRSARMDINSCLSIDILERAITNLSYLLFNNNTIIRGISDGYTVNNQGAKVPLYDSTIALSTAFGYEYSQTTDNIRKDLNIEIERRQYDHSLLLSSFQKTSEACEHAVRMIHYIDYDTDNHIVNVVIPYEDELSQTASFVDDLPSETLDYGDTNTDPSNGILEYEPRASTEKIVTSITRDGVVIDGNAIATNMMSQAYVFPDFLVEVPGATYKHPYRGNIIEVPSAKPESEDDESYYFYRIIGGVKGETVKNPNRGLTERYTPPPDALFDCENSLVMKADIVSVFNGKFYIGVNHESSLAGRVVQLPLTPDEEVTEDALILMELLGYDPSHGETQMYRNPNYQMLGYYNNPDILFDPTSETVTLSKTHIYIDSEAKLNDVYYTPSHTVIGVADSLEMPLENLIPSVRGVLDYMAQYDGQITQFIKDLIAAAIETVTFDFDVKQYAIEYNASLTDYIINSTGGLSKEPEFVMPENPRPGEIPDYEVPALPTDWSLWINIRKWIIQGIIDSLKQQNGRTYWKDCPNYDILNEYLGFAAAMGQLSHIDEKWSWEFFKGDILTWTVGGSSTLSGNSIKFVVHSEYFKSEDKIGGYFCSGSSGFHTGNWIYIGHGKNIPNCNTDSQKEKCNLYCDGRAAFEGDTFLRNSTLVAGDFTFSWTAKIKFIPGAQLIYKTETEEGKEEEKSTSIEDMMNRIETLETENAELKTKIKSMEDDIAYLKKLVKHFVI